MKANQRSMLLRTGQAVSSSPRLINVPRHHQRSESSESPVHDSTRRRPRVSVLCSSVFPESTGTLIVALAGEEVHHRSKVRHHPIAEQEAREDPTTDCELSSWKAPDSSIMFIETRLMQELGISYAVATSLTSQAHKTAVDDQAVYREAKRLHLARRTKRVGRRRVAPM